MAKTTLSFEYEGKEYNLCFSKDFPDLGDEPEMVQTTALSTVITYEYN